MLKTAIVYLHLLATCIALGSVLLTDHRLWRWRHRQLDSALQAQLAETRDIVTLALVALWISGLGLLGVGFWKEGGHYLMNPKLWAKVSVVLLLTLNGILLHRFGFPLMAKAAYAVLPRPDQIRLGLLGATSATGWLFAAFLGIARPWNYVLPYHQVMEAYLGFLLLAVSTALAMAASLRRHAAPAHLATPDRR